VKRTPNHKDNVAKKTLKKTIVDGGRETWFTITPFEPQITEATAIARHPTDLRPNFKRVFSMS